MVMLRVLPLVWIVGSCEQIAEASAELEARSDLVTSLSPAAGLALRRGETSWNKAQATCPLPPLPTVLTSFGDCD
jgi:hypothetical protein